MGLKDYIGKVLKGYCEGYFGRDSYGDKKIVFIGEKYIVAENEHGYPVTAYFDEGETIQDILSKIDEWIKEREEYEGSEDYKIMEDISEVSDVFFALHNHHCKKEEE